jgi:hypothetical protein
VSALTVVVCPVGNFALIETPVSEVPSRFVTCKV